MHATISFHIAGSLSALFTFLSLWGLALQLKQIYIRRDQVAAGQLSELPTAVLSLNRFSTSYLAFYSMMLYGICLPEFNCYVVIPRIVAVLLLLGILYEIWRDRRTLTVTVVLSVAVFALIIAQLVAASGVRATDASQNFSSLLVILSTGLFLQGSIHQISRVRHSGKTGALSRGMHVLFFLKDFFSVALGGVLGAQFGWPLLLFHTTSGTMQLITLWHFRWSRNSAIATQRRATIDGVAHE